MVTANGYMMGFVRIWARLISRSCLKYVMSLLCGRGSLAVDTGTLQKVGLLAQFKDEAPMHLVRAQG